MLTNDNVFYQIQCEQTLTNMSQCWQMLTNFSIFKQILTNVTTLTNVNNCNMYKFNAMLTNTEKCKYILSNINKCNMYYDRRSRY